MKRDVQVAADAISSLGTLEVVPHIVTPPCIRSGFRQDCRNCPLKLTTRCSSPRARCLTPYEGHPNGCPDYGERAGCPPHAPMFDDVFDILQPIFAVVVRFDMAAQMDRIVKAHPDQPQAQLGNPLYWDAAVCRHRRREIHRTRTSHAGLWATTCPEAMGVEVTATMARVGVHLEWPAHHTVHRIALMGRLRDRQYGGILIEV